MTFLERTVVNSHPVLDYEVTSDDEAAAAGEAAGGGGSGGGGSGLVITPEDMEGPVPTKAGLFWTLHYFGTRRVPIGSVFELKI